MTKQSFCSKQNSIKDEFISIGRISGVFGLKGHLKVESSGDILEYLQLPYNLKIGEKDNFSSLHSYTLLNLRKNKNSYILLLDPIHSIEIAEKMKSKILYIEKSKVTPLNNKDEFYIFQLLGLKPVSEGYDLFHFQIREVLDNPAHPILIFTDGKIEVLIPFLDRFVKNINIENSTIEIVNWGDWVED
ncbi:MAG: ribosome maturation factor RimM [Leptospiraceae bacterium]|nr:16S rRNA processing protein RimM [Leptospiraceae bacterium]MCK6379822.1 ribosome maturation factor RimM [Leptospiraceae bacterium]